MLLLPLLRSRGAPADRFYGIDDELVALQGGMPKRHAQQTHSRDPQETPHKRRPNKGPHTEREPTRDRTQEGAGWWTEGLCEMLAVGKIGKGGPKGLNIPEKDGERGP